MRPLATLTTSLCAFMFSPASYAQDLRPYLLGDWQCQSEFSTDFGNSLLLGDTHLADNGDLTGEGNLLLSYPGFDTEIPIAATVQAHWRLEKQRIIVWEVRGNFVSPYPLLNNLADGFEQQLRQQNSGAARLTRLGKKIMALQADDGTEILCIRAS